VCPAQVMGGAAKKMAANASAAAAAAKASARASTKPKPKPERTKDDEKMDEIAKAVRLTQSAAARAGGVVSVLTVAWLGRGTSRAP